MTLQRFQGLIRRGGEFSESERLTSISHPFLIGPFIAALVVFSRVRCPACPRSRSFFSGDVPARAHTHSIYR